MADIISNRQVNNKEKDEVASTKENQNLKDKIQNFIGTLNQAPHHIKDEWIQYGYRINFSSKKAALKSLFMWHNEVINIWTHLLPAIIIIGLVFYICFYFEELLRPRVVEELNGKINLLLRIQLVRFAGFIQEFEEVEQMINQKLQNGIHGIKDEFDFMQNAANSKLGEMGQYLDDIMPLEFVELERKIKTAFNINSMKWQHDLTETLEEYRELAINLVESEQFDWIDLYAQIAISDTKVSRIPIVGFLISAILCLVGSAVFHTFYCISSTTNKILIRLDYAGICFLISGSTFAPVFYGFYCNIHLAYIYSSIQGIFALGVFGLTLFDFFHSVEWRSTKNLLYLCLGVMSGFPIFHLLFGDQSTIQGFTFTALIPGYIGMAASYLIGLTIFQTRCPEKQRPGQFDNCGQSHQIWHISVVIAIFFTYAASLQALYQRIDLPCPV